MVKTRLRTIDEIVAHLNMIIKELETTQMPCEKRVRSFAISFRDLIIQ